MAFQSRPAATTAMQAARLNFLEKYGARLTEGNKFIIEWLTMKMFRDC